ncbi:hypothetical protein B0J11DRAFT_525625 [Dendryphion nanum]|uniref:DUF7730 domain-containing protein n=1 Tax=Dendryphion nanum TaxID=256645 RepID=A0A9P9IPY4_9PLEO|nr:hypothetical protein B0J11DRAFT_525625 [Dendryphion nanum]
MTRPKPSIDPAIKQKQELAASRRIDMRRLLNGVKDTVLSVLGIAFCPCMSVGTKIRDSIRKSKPPEMDYSSQSWHWPDALLSDRASLSIEEGVADERMIKGLFGLPLELRLQIYGLVFGSDVIHVQKSFSTTSSNAYILEYGWCLDEFSRDHDRMCRCFPGSSRDVWKLLLTCKAMYTDVMNAIYRYHTFEFNDLDSFVIFAARNPPSRINTITSLYINAKYIAPGITFTYDTSLFPPSYQAKLFNIPTTEEPTAYASAENDTHTWHAVCDMISKMQSLRRLKVQLCHSAFAEVLFENLANSVTISNEEYIFGPLTRIKQESLHTFEVEVDWPASTDGWDEKDLNFEMTRVGPRMRAWPQDWPGWNHYQNRVTCPPRNRRPNPHYRRNRSGWLC